MRAFLGTALSITALVAASLATGQGAIHRLLSGSLVADCTQLAKLGFAPVVDTKTALRALLRD